MKKDIGIDPLTGEYFEKTRSNQIHLTPEHRKKFHNENAKAVRHKIAEVQRDVAAISSDLNITGVHVGMKKPIPKNLHIKDRYPIRGKLRDVDVCSFKRIDLTDRNAVHTLHHDDVRIAPVPIHLRNEKKFRVSEVTFELAGTRRLTH